MAAATASSRASTGIAGSSQEASTLVEPRGMDPRPRPRERRRAPERPALPTARRIQLAEGMPHPGAPTCAIAGCQGGTAALFLTQLKAYSCALPGFLCEHC